MAGRAIGIQSFVSAQAVTGHAINRSMRAPKWETGERMSKASNIPKLLFMAFVALGQSTIVYIIFGMTAHALLA